MSRAVPAPTEPAPSVTLRELLDYFPFSLDLDCADPWVEWVDIGDGVGDEPFFDWAVGRRLATPGAARAVVTAPDALRLLLEKRAGPAPAGFIFHSARCGSTLLANMLARAPRTVVLREPRSVNAALPRTTSDDVEPGRVELFRAVVHALGRVGRGAAPVLKLSSWNILHHHFIRRAFPDVPAVFLYREPLAVLSSLLEGAPRWNEEESWLSREHDPASQELSPEEYYARLLGRMFAAAHELAASGATLLLHYRELDAASAAGVAARFGLAVDDDVRAAMHACTARDAKSPASPFVRRSPAPVSPLLLECISRHVQAPYEKLEAAALSSARPSSGNDPRPG